MGREARRAASGLQPGSGTKRTSSYPLSEGPHGGFPPPPLRLPDSTSRAATCPLAGPVPRLQRGAGPLNEWRAGRAPSGPVDGAGARRAPGAPNRQRRRAKNRRYHRDCTCRSRLIVVCWNAKGSGPTFQNSNAGSRRLKRISLPSKRSSFRRSRPSEFPVFSSRSSPGEQEDALPVAGGGGGGRRAVTSRSL